uniref:Aldehyde dehydrogenase n=1 Tax=Panagrellus redivivus TaxID=6233 RepID=A0A7E4ZXQ9_PANRE
MASNQYTKLVESQRAYFDTGEPASLAHRKKALLTLKKLIENDGAELVDAVEKDLRRLPGVTKNLELNAAKVEIDYFLENLDEWTAPHYVDKTLNTLLDTPMVVSDAKGVVLLLSPWNYPVNLVLMPLVPIIGSGNTVIIKPSELSSNTADAIERVFSKYFDKEFLAVVQGGIPETTELLKERYDHIVYTGSTPVAKIILAAAAKHITPCTLELGGKCPVIVCDDADIEVTSKRLAWGKWLNCGQTCLAPDYVITTEATKPKLVKELTKNLHEFYGSDIRNNIDYSRIINERHFDRLENLLNTTNGEILFQGGNPDRSDNFIPPVIIDSSLEDPIMADEIFGPILPIITVQDISEAIATIRSMEKPLAAYIFTRSDKNIDRLLKETSSGGVTVNDVMFHMTVDTLPFGGVGHSGFGRYRGKFGFTEFTHPKAVLKRGFFADSLTSARYPPLTPAKEKGMARITGKRIALPKTVKTYLPWLSCLIAGVVIGIVIQKYKTF